MTANSHDLHLHLLTLGGVGGRLESPAATTLLATGKPLALVLYLACAPARTAPRDHLAALLWSSDDLSDARHALRQVLLRLRQQLGADAIGATRDTVTLTAPCTLDRDAFVQAIEQGDLAAAVAHYDGPFLPDLSFPGGREFDEWAALERAALSRRFQVAGQQQVRRLLDGGRQREAVELARRVRDDQPFLESAWHPLLEALLAADDPIAAAVEVAALERLLVDEEQESSPATRALAARARQVTLSRPVDTQAITGDLVGREREFAAILGAWDEVRRLRHGRHLHVRGDAGLGKTRLLRDVARRVSAAGARTVSLAAAPGDAAVPWSVLARLAQALAALPGARGIAPACARQLVRLNPALSAVYDVAAEGDGTTDTTLRERALAVADLFGAVAEERAVVLLLDDLHWWDVASLDALSIVASAATARSALLVTASRGRVAPLLASATPSELLLAPLDAVRLDTLVSSIAVAPSAEWAQAVAQALLEGSGGNPLLALAALDDACRTSVLQRSDGQWHALDLAQLTRRLRSGDALRSRVNALGEKLRWALLVLAVAARPLSAESWRAAIGVQPATDSVALPAGGAVRGVLDDLAMTGMVLEDGGRWNIAHDLLATSLIDWSSADDVRAAHVALGRVYTMSMTTETVQLGVHHFLQAGDDANARVSVRRWCVARRASGDRRPVVALLADIGLSAARGTPSALLAQMLEALPWSVRRPRWRVAALGAGLSVLLLATLYFATRRHPASAPPLALVVAVGAGDSLRLLQLDVDTSVAARGRAITLDAGTHIATVVPRQAYAGFLRRGAGDAGIVLHRFSGDTGGFDIYRVGRDGSVVRLTHAAGDDIDPDWSPDGRYVVFQTSRWIRDAAIHTQLAVMTRDGAALRPLTDGRTRDSRPRWSPDGRRIAFLRREGGEGDAERTTLCWTTIDGQRQVCHATRADGAGSLFGWADDAHVWVNDANAVGRLTLHAVDSGVERSVMSAARRVVDVEPSGWTVGYRGPGGAWVVSAPGGGWYREVLSARDSIELVTWWPDRVPLAPITGLVARDAEATWPVGVALSVPIDARHADGTRRALTDGVVQWESRSPAAAVRGTRIEARDTGRVLLYANLGGWVRDSVWLHFAHRPLAPLLTETWTDTRLSAWTAFGDPAVRVVSLDGRPALLVAGDATFVSGVVSKQQWPVDGGLGVEFEVRTPISRDTWQRLQLSLVADPRIVIGGVQTTSTCLWSYPAREEPDAFRSASVVPGVDTVVSVDAPGGVGDTAWHRVQLQWLPDGSCGVAVDGRVVARGRAEAQPRTAVAVAIEGQSVGTTVLVRSVRVWRGTNTAVRW